MSKRSRTHKSKKSSKAAAATPRERARDAARAGALKRVVAGGPPMPGSQTSAAGVPPSAGNGAETKKRETAAPKAKAAKEKKPKKMSGLDAAALVIAEAKKPMNMKTVLEQIQGRKLWTSNGKTPGATLYAAIVREIAAKGKESRFKKHDRGMFVAA